MEKRSGVIAFVFLLLITALPVDVFALSVTYDGNGSNGGTAPTDASAYSSGTTVTVLGNTGALTKTGYSFGGWNTQANGRGTTYSAGATFSITADTTLYAKWPGMLDYCMTPAFLQAGILPNVLLMLDNSASMFDLAHADKGKAGTCSNIVTKSCFVATDCAASGATCDNSPRKPSYCNDNTYSDAGGATYTGYFTPAFFYDYNITNGKFTKIDTFPASGDCTFYIADKFCVATDGSTPKKVTKFSASGNYLNWLTASKFDVQKKILTGGKWDGANLIAESRGCVGRGFIKQPLSSNSGNYVEGGTNTPFNISLSIKGFKDSFDETAPSQGGQTSIYFYSGSSPLNSEICQQAIDSLETANSINQTVRDQVVGCIGASGGTTDLSGKKKQIFQQALQECWQYFENDPDGIVGSDYLTVKNFCTDVYNLRDPNKALTKPSVGIKVGDPDLICSENYVGACYSGQIASLQLPNTSYFAFLSPNEAFAAAGTVQFGSATYSVNENGGSVTVVVQRTGGADGKIDVTYTTANGTAAAGTDYVAKTGTLTWNNNNSANQTISFAINDNNIVSGNKTFTISLASTNAVLGSPATATVTIVDNDIAGATGTIGFDTAVPGAVNEAAGTITLNVQRLGGSTGVVSAVYATSNGTATAGSDYTTTSGTLIWGDGDSTVKSLTIPILSDAVAELNETFTVTLAGITVGTPATSTVTITESAVSSGPNAWLNSWTSDACVKTQHVLYCKGMDVPPVTDPTNIVLDTTSNYNNLPAVIADIAVEGQLGAPLKLVSGGTDYTAATVKLAATEPSGLVQDFKDKIRIGVMSFNYNGSATECAAGTVVPCPKICSNSPDMNFPKTCVTALDCCAATDSCSCDATTANTTNKDGARILHYVGRGICTNDNSIECTAETASSVCGVTPPENARCNVVGTHATGLVNVIDNINASNWTPFSEGFYNAIGYFARNDDGTSRTDLQIYSSDFVGNKNPSIASCQQNNVLIISDGVATADQNPTVKALADTATSGTYSPNAGGTSGDCPDYKGSKNLDKLSWLANKRKISNFSATPVDARDHITTYSVYNGADTYTAADECNSATMMKNTATKGGGNFYQAVNAGTMQDQLQSAFDDISAKVSSGTAAAVANNKSGERGANIIQALFYPKWPNDLEKKWMGDIQALWFYVDPIVKFSGIYEDTGVDKQLNLATDRAPGNDSLAVEALWKAGELLHARAASNRAIYTLLDPTQVLTNAANEFNSSTAAKRTALKPLLDINALDDGQADKIINFVRGSDGDSSIPVLRSRKVTNNGVTNAEWKLGDVINSTPQIQGNTAQNKYDIEYGDISYSQFTNSTNYRTNNYVYAGSNDGMLHAFKLGLVSTVKDPNNPFKIAEITDPTDIGKEIWSYIPKNVLPYLKNCSDPNYCHQFLVDGAPLLFDASINKYDGCTQNNYWECPRLTTLPSNALDATHTSWRSILIGSMGLGGATRNLGASCNKTSAAGPDEKCINTPVDGIGYSSYFALDVTTPTTPRLLWEFSDASIDADPSLDAAGKTATKGLGLTTPGGIQIRVNSRKIGTPAVADRATNGRWFAVFPSGPTGPIDTGTHQFLGQSDQNLKIYIVDLNPANGAVSGSSTGDPEFRKCTSAAASNCNYWVKDTGIKYAFANSLFNAAIDIDKGDGGSESNYSDDVVYITYTKASLDNSASPGPYPVAWDKGGVLRLITNNDPDPFNWFTSKLIDDIGPVTRSVDILQDKNNKKLWVFFGEARYFFRQDDLHTQRRIFGVADPCYSYDLDSLNKLSTTLARCPSVNSGSDPLGNLNDQSGTPDEPTTTQKGWFINLEEENANYAAERLSGGISSRTNGLVLFTTFIPSMDPCDAGGLPSQWAVNYKTGGAAPPGSLQGKVVMTTSDSPIAKTINLAGAFTQRGGRKLAASLSAGLKGMPPPSPPPSLILPEPARKILQIQER